MRNLTEIWKSLPYFWKSIRLQPCARLCACPKRNSGSLSFSSLIDLEALYKQKVKTVLKWQFQGYALNTHSSLAVLKSALAQCIKDSDRYTWQRIYTLSGLTRESLSRQQQPQTVGIGDTEFSATKMSIYKQGSMTHTVIKKILKSNSPQGSPDNGLTRET